MAVPGTKNSLPTRYDSLRDAIMRIADADADSLEEALVRVEVRRLRAESKLRELLVRHWANNLDKQFNQHRPADILNWFIIYARTTFFAVARECGPLYRTHKAFTSLLYSARDWVVTQIVPQRQKEYPNIEVQEIIRLHETVAAFKQRITKPGVRYEASLDVVLGGDWEHLLDDTLYLAKRSEREYWDSDKAICVALRDQFNLEQATGVLEVELESENPILLSGWWEIHGRVGTKPTVAGSVDKSIGQASPNRASISKRRVREPHPNPEKFLEGKTRVTPQTSATVLGVTERRVRQLVAEGQLDTIGEGHARQIDAQSLWRRLGGSKIRNPAETSGNSRKLPTYQKRS